jgi:hypothetical protein
MTPSTILEALAKGLIVTWHHDGYRVAQSSTGALFVEQRGTPFTAPLFINNKLSPGFLAADFVFSKPAPPNKEKK